MNFKRSILSALALAGSLLPYACASQSAGVLPNHVSGDIRDSFDHVAQKLDNPCAESDLQKYSSLDELIRAGKKCRESWLLSETISFFLDEAGYDENDVLTIAKAELRNHLSPAQFNLEGRPRRGPDNAPVQIVIFSDFQCPYCSRGADTLERIAQQYPEDAQIIFKNMPLVRIHPQALPAALCAVYANTKGKFWQVHDKFFANQKKLEPAFIVGVLENDLGGTVEEVYDPDQGRDYALYLTEDMDDASNARIHGTPTFFINGVQIEAGLSYKRLAHRIEAERTAPPATDPGLKQRVRERILQRSPFLDPRLTEQYNLLDTKQKSATFEIAGSIPCPCPESGGTIEECANIRDTCPAAQTILSRLMQRIAENASENAILDEIQSLFVKARMGSAE